MDEKKRRHKAPLQLQFALATNADSAAIGSGKIARNRIENDLQLITQDLQRNYGRYRNESGHEAVFDHGRTRLVLNKGSNETHGDSPL
jgi:hypothetical protein